MKGGQIMDGRHERTRLAPKHSAIAWHVQHVEPEAFRQTWQKGLVPQDVLQRRAKSLGNSYEPHFSRGETEQIQILLQDEEGKFMFFMLKQSAAKGKHVLGNAALAALNHRRGKANMHKAAAG
jgi:hypothetical protein